MWIYAFIHILLYDHDLTGTGSLYLDDGESLSSSKDLNLHITVTFKVTNVNGKGSFLLYSVPDASSHWTYVSTVTGLLVYGAAFAPVYIEPTSEAHSEPAADPVVEPMLAHHAYNITGLDLAINQPFTVLYSVENHVVPFVQNTVVFYGAVLSCSFVILGFIILLCKSKDPERPEERAARQERYKQSFYAPLDDEAWFHSAIVIYWTNFWI